MREDNTFLTCTKSGTSSIESGKEFQTGVILGKKLNLKVSSVLVEYSLNFLEWIAFVGVGVRCGAACISSRPLMILYSIKSWSFVVLESIVFQTRS